MVISIQFTASFLRPYTLELILPSHDDIKTWYAILNKKATLKTILPDEQADNQAGNQVSGDGARKNLMRKMIHLFYFIKALFFRAIIFFPFECCGYLYPWGALSKGSKKRIAFQAYNPQTAQVFLPIINELKKRAGLEIWFIVMFHPYHGLKGLIDTKTFAIKELGIEKNSLLFVWEAYWRRFDALVCSDVYAKFPVTKTKKLLIPHGAGLLSRWVVKNPLRKTVSDFNAYLLCGDFDLLQVKEHLSGKTELHSVGFPFVDALFHDSTRSGLPDHDAAVQADHQKVVLYAPSWGHTYAYGDILSRNIKEVMACLRDKAVRVLLKLHAASYIPAQAKVILWRTKINRYLDGDQVQIITQLDDRPFFKAADILITDISSRSFNFMITGKPVIIYGVPDRYSQSGIESIRMKKIYAGAYRAQTPVELSIMLDRCLQTPHEMALERQKVVKEVFTNPGCAASTTARVIRQVVDQT
jgi:hypothetical protein